MELFTSIPTLSSKDKNEVDEVLKRDNIYDKVAGIK